MCLNIKIYRGKYFGIFSGYSSGKSLLFWTCLGKVCRKNRIFPLNFGISVLNFGISVHNFGIFALNPGEKSFSIFARIVTPVKNLQY